MVAELQDLGQAVVSEYCARKTSLARAVCCSLGNYDLCYTLHYWACFLILSLRMRTK